ncbi:MAG: alcohol dehydrogenase catalytic domain-containing protein [Candidatus Bathyarchaeia archaeon]
MKAAIFYEANKPLKVEDVQAPRINPSDVLVKIKKCGICHTDIAIWSGTFPPRKGPPLILGHEISGEIVNVGENVKNFNVGDRIAVDSFISCSKCFYCLTGNDNLCERGKRIGIDVDGGFAEFISIPEENAIKLPDEITFSEAALLEPMSICYRAVKVANVQIEDVVALFGLGGLGLITLQLLAKLRGAKVIAIDVIEEKLQTAKELGATEVINAAEKNPVEEIMKMTSNRGADCAIEVVGRPITQEQAVRCIRKGGKAVLVGAAMEPIKVNPQRFFREEINITGAFGCQKSDLPKLIEIIKEGKVDLKRLISHEIDIEEINFAFKVARGDIKEEKPMRVLISA